MTVLADLFLQLRIPQNVIRYIYKKSIFRGPFDSQHGKRAQTLLASERWHHYHI